ncbi:hypothetical protein AMJ47_01390 [Parcubacteria bacterium DG_72]|nr:MAG: hypothetical protein AMJ47_01390 [Parcubacteria bacterium DG_72]
MKDTNEGFIKEYRLRGVKFPPRPWLSDEAFNEACLVFIRVCADVFFIQKEKGIIYLAYRIIPIRAWMGFGGAVDPGEGVIEAGCRNVKQDTGLEIPAKKLCYLDQTRITYLAYGEPRDSLAFQFYCEVKPGEIDSIRLNSKEYDVQQGVQSFNKDRLMQEQSLLHPEVMDTFNLIFSQTA